MTVQIARDFLSKHTSSGFALQPDLDAAFGGFEDDTAALRGDWEAVGDDLWKAIEVYTAGE
jgi:hypothetical protein